MTTGSMRLATPKDKATFVHLWAEYLKEAHDRWNGLPATASNLLSFNDLFMAYTRGHTPGLCVLWEVGGKVEGVLLAGENPDLCSFNGTEDRVVQVWGVYITPEHRREGAGAGLEAWAEPYLLEMGFQVAHSYTQWGDEAGEKTARAQGGTPVEVTWAYTLKKRQ